MFSAVFITKKIKNKILKLSIFFRLFWIFSHGCIIKRISTSDSGISLRSLWSLLPYVLTQDGPPECLTEPSRHHVVQNWVDGGAHIQENNGEIVQSFMVYGPHHFGPAFVLEVWHDSYDVER